MSAWWLNWLERQTLDSWTASSEVAGSIPTMECFSQLENRADHRTIV